MLNWKTLTICDKINHITDLHAIRQQMQLDARTKKATKPRKKKLRTQFKSKELEDLFNSLPPDIQRMVS